MPTPRSLPAASSSKRVDPVRRRMAFMKRALEKQRAEARQEAEKLMQALQEEEEFVVIVTPREKKFGRKGEYHGETAVRGSHRSCAL